uniref:Uncharacterized protein n=1 Tax=Glossina pallidipes TaxID=7398 RepID=A0A1A9ZIF4_GLOPL
MLMPLRPVVVAAILCAVFAVVAIACVDTLEIRVTSVENVWNDDDDDDDDDVNVDNDFDGCVCCMPRRPVVITFPLLILFSSQLPLLPFRDKLNLAVLRYATLR